MQSGVTIVLFLVAILIGIVVGKFNSDANAKCDKACIPYGVAYCKFDEVGCWTTDETTIRHKRF